MVTSRRQHRLDVVGPPASAPVTSTELSGPQLSCRVLAPDVEHVLAADDRDGRGHVLGRRCRTRRVEGACRCPARRVGRRSTRAAAMSLRRGRCRRRVAVRLAVRRRPRWSPGRWCRRWSPVAGHLDRGEHAAHAGRVAVVQPQAGVVDRQRAGPRGRGRDRAPGRRRSGRGRRSAPRRCAGSASLLPSIPITVWRGAEHSHRVVVDAGVDVAQQHGVPPAARDRRRCPGRPCR